MCDCNDFVGILFLFTIFVPEMNNRLGLSFDVAFPMTGYLFYICAGAAIARCRVIERKYRNLAWGAVCVMILIYFISGRDKIYTYTSIPVCIMALSVFILVTKGNISVGGGRKRLLELSKDTLGIYLIHPFFLNLLLKTLHIYPLHWTAWLSVPTTCIFVFLLSYLTVHIIRRIPVVGRLI